MVLLVGTDFPFPFRGFCEGLGVLRVHTLERGDNELIEPIWTKIRGICAYFSIQ